jgi:hypothetical protein
VAFLGEYGSPVLEDGRGAAATAPEQKVAVFTSALDRVVSPLREAGHQVILVSPNPGYWRTMSRPAPACPTIVVLSDVAKCGSILSQAQALSDQRSLTEVLTSVSDDTGSEVLNLWSHFCEDGVCRTYADHRWMFWDGVHISVGESEALAPDFARALSHVGASIGDQGTLEVVEAQRTKRSNFRS